MSPKKTHFSFTKPDNSNARFLIGCAAAKMQLRNRILFLLHSSFCKNRLLQCEKATPETKKKILEKLSHEQNNFSISHVHVVGRGRGLHVAISPRTRTRRATACPLEWVSDLFIQFLEFLFLSLSRIEMSTSQSLLLTRRLFSFDFGRVLIS